MHCRQIFTYYSKPRRSTNWKRSAIWAENFQILRKFQIPVLSTAGRFKKNNQERLCGMSRTFHIRLKSYENLKFLNLKCLFFARQADFWALVRNLKIWNLTIQIFQIPVLRTAIRFLSVTQKTLHGISWKCQILVKFQILKFQIPALRISINI